MDLGAEHFRYISGKFPWEVKLGNFGNILCKIKQKTWNFTRFLIPMESFHLWKFPEFCNPMNTTFDLFKTNAASLNIWVCFLMVYCTHCKSNILKWLLFCIYWLFSFYLCLKGPMSWPFLLIIIPLLRYTKIDLYCAIFQTHIGFSYSISV